MHKLITFLILASINLIASAADGSSNLGMQQSAATPLSVYTAGDIADCRTKKSTARSVATAELVQEGLRKNPDSFVLTLGDHTYPVGSPAEFNNCYEPSWGKFKLQTYPAPGNHEYYSPEAYAYFEYFRLAAGSQQQSYYSVDKGSWHIISLNSNLKDAEQQKQLDWLAQDLKKQHAECILAYWHHPVYSSGFHGNNALMTPAWELLMAAKADVVLNGHDHHYERFALQNSQGEKDMQLGLREFVVGTGGAKLGPVLWRKAQSEALNTKENGVLKLTLNHTSYSWQFIPVPESSFSDEGSTACHQK